MPLWLQTSLGVVVKVLWFVGDVVFAWVVTVAHALSLREWQRKRWYDAMTATRALPDSKAKTKKLVRLDAEGAYMGFVYAEADPNNLSRFSGEHQA